MRHVFPTHDVMRHFAHGEVEDSRNSSQSVSYSGTFGQRGIVSKLYSYHTPIAAEVRNAHGERVFYVTSQKYSKTTAKHVHEVLRAIDKVGGQLVFRFPVVASGGWNRSIIEWGHEDILHYFLAAALESIERAGRARKYGSFHLTVAHNWLSAAHNYIDFHELPRSRSDIFDVEAKFQEVSNAPFASKDEAVSYVPDRCDCCPDCHAAIATPHACDCPNAVAAA